jgi:hypothetical protein
VILGFAGSVCCVRVAVVVVDEVEEARVSCGVAGGRRLAAQAAVVAGTHQ